MRPDSGQELVPERSRRFLAQVANTVDGLAPIEVAGRISTLVSLHERWRTKECLNMLGAENILSREARRLLDSDLATRVTEGFPGAKDAQGGRLNHVIDEIEGIVIALATRLFRCSYVDWRPLSNSMANASALASVSSIGDTICVQSMAGGGNMSYHQVGVAGLQGLDVVEMPVGPDFGIDLDRLEPLVRATRPRALVVGGSRVLFPYPVAGMRALADEVEAAIIYDAAHLAPLIAAGMFQDPLEEGADLLTTSTHKFLGGPVGGLVMTNRADLAERFFRITHPGLLQTRDQNKTAALAYSLAETSQYGSEYAVQTVQNAKFLAEELVQFGFDLMGADRGYTETHQIFVNAADIGPRLFERRCQQANILVKCTPGTPDGGGPVREVVRISVQELTRRGLRRTDMQEVAHLIHLAVSGDDSEKLRQNVADLVGRFPEVVFTFDGVEPPDMFL